MCSKKIAVIAGNGPSLKKLDYTRLPNSFDLFRCNLFFMEEKYFLGKEIKGVVCCFPVFQNLFFTLQQLKLSNEYSISNIITRFDSKLLIGNSMYGTKNIKDFFPTVIDINDYLQKLPKFNEWDKFYRFYYQQEPTSGIYTLISAIAQGYEEIYLTGFDFYENGAGHFYDPTSKTELCKIIPEAKVPSHSITKCHSFEIERHFLIIATNMVNLYSLNPDSTLSQIIPLAQQLKEHTDPKILVQDKSPNAIKDLIPLPYSIQQNKTIKEEIYNELSSKGLLGKIKKNIFINLMRDLLVLVKAMSTFVTIQVRKRK